MVLGDTVEMEGGLTADEAAEEMVALRLGVDTMLFFDSVLVETDVLGGAAREPAELMLMDALTGAVRVGLVGWSESLVDTELG